MNKSAWYKNYGHTEYIIFAPNYSFKLMPLIVEGYQWLGDCE